MSLKLITLAALGTAAQAATTYSKAKCITGYASNLQKDKGIPLVVIDSTAGYCMAGAFTPGDTTTKSMLLQCDESSNVGPVAGSKKMYYQKSTSLGCTGIIKCTDKQEQNEGCKNTPFILMTGAGAPTCEGTGLVQGVDLSTYSDKVCKTSVAVMPVTNAYCMADGTVSKKVTCNKEKTQVTINSYTGVKCAGKAKNVYNFKSNDGKCHNPDQKPLQKPRQHLHLHQLVMLAPTLWPPASLLLDLSFHWS